MKREKKINIQFISHILCIQSFFILQEEAEKYSHKFGDDAKSLCQQLLAKSVKNRLGCRNGRHGAREAKLHSFFNCLNWKRLEAGMVEPPFLPDVSFHTEAVLFISS